MLRLRIVAFLILAAAPAYAESRLPSFYDDLPHEELAKKIINAMSCEELLAQTFMFGWAGQDPAGLLTDWIQTVGLGSVKVFGRNTGDSIKLAHAITLLQKKAASRRFNIPLFVATDQEGGWVRHVKGLTSDSPGNLAIGASGIPHDAYYAGFYISQELRALGINMNFAPTVDLYTHYDSTIIGPRSFGEQPEQAGRLGAAFMQGSRQAGVLTTAKHFPGHGATGLDSHGFLPQIAISKKTLYERELVPFITLIDKGIPLIMSGHLSFPHIIPNNIPATFSRYMLHTILREQLGFNGLIITDDMMMKAAIDYAGGIAQAVQLALEAGNNIIESSTTPRFYHAFWQNTLQRVKTDKAFYTLVRNSAYRIILTKLRYFKSPNHVPIYPDITAIPEKVPDPAAQAFFLSLAARSVTSVRNKDMPYYPDAADRIMLAGNYSYFFNAGKKRFPQASTFYLTENITAHAAQADTIIYCLAKKDEIAPLQKLLARYPEKRIFVISALSPVHIKAVPEAKNILAVYSYSPPAFTAAFAALCGDFTPRGHMPIDNIQ